MRKELGLVLLLIVAACAPLYLPAYELSLLGRFLALAVLAPLGLGGYAIAMHLKLASSDPGSIPDFMQWTGLSALPWWWAPFRSPAVAIGAALVLPALAAALLAYLVFRRRVTGAYFAIITQALALATTTFIISQQQFTGGFNGLTGFTSAFGFTLGDPSTQLGLYWVTLAVLASAFVGIGALQNSAFGKILLAVRDGENRVRFLGYDPLPFKVIAFAIAGLLAGISGALVTLDLGVISPAMFGVVPSIEMVIWVALGGRNSLLGAIVGTLAVNFGKDWISSAFPDLWLYIVGAIFVLVVTIAPQGLVGLVTFRGRTQRALRATATAVVPE